MFARYYYLFIIVSLILSSLTSIYFVSGWAEKSIFGLINKTIQQKAALAEINLDRYLSTRVKILQDIASNPALANSVMGSDTSLDNTADYLDEVKILGNKESLGLYDFASEPIHFNKSTTTGEFSNPPKFVETTISTAMPVISIRETNQSHYFTIAVPVFYAGNAEGVLIAFLSNPFSEIFANTIADSLHAIRIKSTFNEFTSVDSISNYITIRSHKMDNADILMEYYVDEQVLQQKRSEFTYEITIAIFSSLAATFLFLSLLGKKFILNPYRSLASSQQEIKEQKEKNDLLAQALDASPVGVSIANATKPDMPLEYINPAFLQITGYKREDIIGKNCRFLQGEETSEEEVTSLRRAIKSQSKCQVEFINYDKNGNPFWNDLTISPVFNDYLELTSYVGIQQDITQRKYIEQELKDAMQKAEDAAQAKSEFLASMSHEIRTPMNGVIGMLRMLLKDNLTSTQNTKTTMALSSAESLLSIINDILDFSKIEAGKLEIEHTPFNLHELLESSTIMLSHQASEKGISFELNTEFDNSIQIISDPTRIRQIILNLASNAIKFTSDGNVTINASIQHINNQDNLSISVCDTGIGIPEQKISKLFDSFTQVDASTTRHFGGSGLGLSIVKNLCSLMNGTIDVASMVNEGSTFTVQIPIEITATKTETSSASQSHSNTQVKKDHYKILLVEDNKINQVVSEGCLEELGYKCDIATHGHEAIEMISLISYDLILMDCQMPVLDGYEATKQIRHSIAGDANRDITIIAMTANAMKGDKEKCLLAGMDDYISKPIDQNILDQKLSHWLGEAPYKLKPKSNQTEACDSEWTRELAAKRFGGNEVLLGKLINIFLEETPNDVQSLHEAIHNRDHKESVRFSHMLKSVFGNLSAPDLSEVMRAAEHAAREDDYEYLDAMWPEFSDQFYAFYEQIKQSQ